MKTLAPSKAKSTDTQRMRRMAASIIQQVGLAVSIKIKKLYYRSGIVANV